MVWVLYSRLMLGMVGSEGWSGIEGRRKKKQRMLGFSISTLD